MSRNRLLQKWMMAVAVALWLPSASAFHELNLPSNEQGKVMVLMYHHIGPRESTWTRTPAKFREDLELLYQKGYYLVNTVDLVNGKLNVPRGKTPVVLTFDDFAPGQISKINGQWDPNCAVGMINEAAERHPDFGRAGSFYLNVHKDEPSTPDSDKIAPMLREMVELGYELGNHTMSHPKLNELDQVKVAREIAGVQKWVASMIPGYEIKTMAMPFGIYPKEEAWAVDGEYNGVAYHHLALLKVGSEPSISPMSTKFRKFRISRVRASETFDHPNEKDSLAYFRNAITYFDRHPEQRWIK